MKTQIIPNEVLCENYIQHYGNYNVLSKRWIYWFLSISRRNGYINSWNAWIQISFRHLLVIIWHLTLGHIVSRIDFNQRDERSLKIFKYLKIQVLESLRSSLILRFLFSHTNMWYVYKILFRRVFVSYGKAKIILATAGCYWSIETEIKKFVWKSSICQFC